MTEVLKIMTLTVRNLPYNGGSPSPSPRALYQQTTPAPACKKYILQSERLQRFYIPTIWHFLRTCTLRKCKHESINGSHSDHHTMQTLQPRDVLHELFVHQISFILSCSGTQRIAWPPPDHRSGVIGHAGMLWRPIWAAHQISYFKTEVYIRLPHNIK